MEMIVQLDGNKRVSTFFNGHLIKTDQPIKDGGSGSEPAPFDLFLSSIATCAGFYVQNFCEARGIPHTNIKIVQKMNYNREKKLIDKIEIEILLPEDFPEKYRNAVVNAADLCTVKRHLHNPPEILVNSVLSENID